EYWSIDAKLCEKGESYAFSAKLQTKNGEKIEIKTGEEASSIVDELKGVPFVIGAIKKSIRKKQPAPPFITSTLQQEASLRLGFQPRRTMRIAQELYEGIDVPGMGAVGLITYMRTDSLRVSAEAKQAAAAYIEQTFGKEYLPSAAKAYKTKAGAQDAHEAIRPTMPEINPEKLKSSLTPEQYKLYKLVWDRFIASQMAAALYDTVSIDINAGDYGFKASGFSVRFDGFSVLYPYGDEEKSSIPKHANSGDVLKVREIKPNQHFTAPPSRFTEASLIKALEENGIGRPSTYAPIITTIISRNYVERDGKALKPTALGTVTVDLITEHFANIVDVDFTAKMEKDLDKVESGKTDWVHMIKKFYEDFQKSLELAQKNQGAEKIKVPEEETDVICEKCGRKMVVKTGRFGKFLACPGYPQCQNTKRIVKETLGECPLCGAKILSKKSKTGKTYYGCEHNPTCGFMSWDEPTAEKCPTCGKSLLYKKGRSAKIYCSNPECDYERAVAAK
ncbi:MAG: type I DNA topoisomerase, partial [Oscillospiraceae bacterium]|nr:type I DNA topoisomerase [Oscillospiraceae bacterium]